MGNKITNALGENLRKPTPSLAGFFIVERVLRRKNRYLSENAAKLCEIEADHQVLELGFGPGIGLENALKYTQDGNGKVFGLDFSPYMVDMCSKHFASEISSGKLQLIMSSVQNIPLNSNKFDRVFHCNCYYFWEDMQRSCAEVYRVMKPHSMMVTTIDLKSVNTSRDKGILSKYKTDPLMYMGYLESVGFKNIQIKYFNDVSGKEFQAIFAYIEEKEQFLNEMHISKGIDKTSSEEI